MTDKQSMCRCDQLFEKRRDLWLEALIGNDQNSISRQITSLLWYAAVFEVVNESRRLAPPLEEDGVDPLGVQLNGMVHNLIDYGFLVSQKIGIRRLLDVFELDNPKRGVYSLVALLNDVAKHASLITRSRVFKAEEIPYDCSEMRREYEHIRDQQRATQNAYAMPFKLDPRRCEHRHQQFDWLAGVLPEGRGEDDSIRTDVLIALRTRVETAGAGIRDSVNKYIAHAASPATRGTVRAGAVTLGELREAHKVICQVANFLAVDVLGGANLGLLPIAQFDQFEYIERPFVVTSAIPHLRQTWHQIEQEMSSWRHWRPEGYPYQGT